MILGIGQQVVDDGRLGGAAGTGAFQCLILFPFACYLLCVLHRMKCSRFCFSLVLRLLCSCHVSFFFRVPYFQQVISTTGLPKKIELNKSRGAFR